MPNFSLSDVFSKRRQLRQRSAHEGPSQSSPGVIDNDPEAEQSTFPGFTALRSRRIYDDLRKQDLIRLIKLESTAASTSKGYELRTFAVRKAPKYYALSYCWGSSERATQITCNGEPLQISEHLSEGLKELQSLPELSRKWFWIDQVCVNQDDLDERAHQVKLMREIYTHAVSTVIWIGICDGPCEEAFSLAQDLFIISQNDENSTQPKYSKVKILQPGNLFEEDLLSLNLPEISHPSWRELDLIFAKPCFRRMWIIQEVILSRKLPLLVYGSRIRNWEHILWTSLWLHQRGRLVLYGVIRTRNLTPLTTLFVIWATRRPWELQSLLLITNESQSTDPRDKIISLLSIAAETQRNARLPALLVPNYKKEFELVCRDFIYYFISTSRDLALFSMIRQGETSDMACGQDSATPLSWVPRFRQPYLGTVVYAILLNEKKSVIYKVVRMSASKDTPASIQESQDPNTLNLQGLQIDGVKWVSGSAGLKCTCSEDDKKGISEQLSPGKEPFIALRWCEEGARRLIPSKHQTFEAYLKPFLHVLSKGGTESIGIAPSNNEFWDYLGAEGLQSPNLIYFLKFLKETRSEEIGHGDGHLDRHGRMYESRSANFFLTEKQMMGIGPPAMQEGDIMCVLFGGHSPLALRPCDDHYHLLGECYVSELIDGQAIDDWKANKIKEEWFVLR